jgi:hypothetical protein
MPYIKKEERGYIDHLLEPLADFKLDSGKLNYVITKILLFQKPECYDDYNSLIGTLECVKQEFYRRQIGPYEDEAKKRNGDVY